MENRIFLLYGFWFQSQLRKVLFGESYWKIATEKRRSVFFLDVPFTGKMMQMLDWAAVWSIGMAPMGSMVPKKDERASFQKVSGSEERSDELRRRIIVALALFFNYHPRHLPYYSLRLSKDFHEAFYKYKEKKFKAKQGKNKDGTVAETLAAKTHTRLIKIFSKIGEMMLVAKRRAFVDSTF